jgi:thiol-disulfide isomerase/thioredoxin
MLVRSLLTIAAAAVCLVSIGCDAAPSLPHVASHPLVGRPAPQFQASFLDGQPFDLANTQGKVVILDFWATWCPPCRKALPELIALAAEYKDRGVELFAVDVGESPDDVRAYLEEAGLDVQVVLDEDGSASGRYLVEYLPQTVIIGRDGQVAAVHVGAVQDLRGEVGQELEKLLAKPTQQ